MEFLDMLIRILHDEKIVLISCGAFYMAIGGDAQVKLCCYRIYST